MSRHVLLCALVAAAAPAAAADGPVGPAFFALSVSDLDESVQWYAEMLDLEATHLPGSGPVRVALLQSETLIVELIQHPDAVALGDRLPELSRRHLVHGLFKAGFFVEDLDAAIAQLTARGARFRGEAFTDTVLGARSILLQDNAGNVIQLFQRLPSEDAATGAPSAAMRRAGTGVNCLSSDGKGGTP